ncbi:MAG: tetratricopeptide repeat protein [Anaerolineae bacterium]|nr:tetratricopeptide repeat protein [Anaerolineae bacterium]
MAVDLTRAQILLDTQRYHDAETELRKALSHEPNHAPAHALLAYTLYQQNLFPAALHEVQAAIGLEPTRAHFYYIKALILIGTDKDGRALAAIQEAMRLDPEVPAYYATLALLHTRKKAWRQAVRAAETGLQLAPDHVGCANMRAMALVNLGEQGAAQQTLSATLARDPENPLTHANQGWACLHRGDQAQAFDHFREALRLDPTLGWAREGIIEALKARNLIYRWLLRYFLWMSRLTDEEQWGALAFITGTRRALVILARQIPILYIIVAPILLLYFFFIFLTWVGRPLFALFLRLDRFGRLALPKDEIVASNWVGACLGIGIFGAVMGVLTVIPSVLWQWPFFTPGFLILSIAGFLLMMPVAGIFRCHPGGWRTALIVYTTLLALTGGLAFVLALIPTPWGMGLGLGLGLVFLTGWIISSWIASLFIVFAQPA